MAGTSSARAASSSLCPPRRKTHSADRSSPPRRVQRFEGCSRPFDRMAGLCPLPVRPPAPGLRLRRRARTPAEFAHPQTCSTWQRRARPPARRPARQHARPARTRWSSSASRSGTRVETTRANHPRLEQRHRRVTKAGRSTSARPTAAKPARGPSTAAARHPTSRAATARARHRPCRGGHPRERAP